MGGGLTPSLLLAWLGKRGSASKEGSGFLSSGETVAGEQMTIFRVYDIIWDVDGASVMLPSEVEIACADRASLPGALSDAYGWLVTDFKVVSAAGA